MSVSSALEVMNPADSAWKWWVRRHWAGPCEVGNFHGTETNNSEGLESTKHKASSSVVKPR